MNELLGEALKAFDVIELQSQGVDLKTLEVDPTDKEAFEAAVDAAQGSEEVAKSGRSIGETFIDGIKDIKNGYDGKLEQIQETITQPRSLSFQEILKLQVDLAKIAVRGELISKAATRMTQNLDTLMKSQ